MDLTARLAAALAGRYALEEQIGEGGMATVFRARDLRHDRQVAVKLLKPDLGAVLGGERFLAEIRVTANLQHPNLLPLFDSGAADGLLYYVMPYVPGESLRARLERERQLPVEEAVRLAKALASALDYAHRKGVIHRDLKPENILLQDGEPLIADFGIALAVSNAGGQRVTQTGLSLGTPQYMSPEQATGDRVLDARSDLYALGAITYELLAGEPPHAGATAQAVIAKLMTEEPRPLRALRKTVPVAVEQAVRCALEKLPADRFATAKAFADALEGRHTSMPVYTEGAGVREARRRWYASPAWVAVSALLAVGLGGTVVRGRVGPAALASDTLTSRFSLDPLPGTFPTGEVVVSSDGSRIAFVARDSGGAQRLYLRAIDALEPRVVPGSEDGSAPAFSPDGSALAYLANGELRKVRLSDGSTAVLARVQGSLRSSSGNTLVRWAAPERLVVTSGGRLSTVSANGGVVTPVPTNDTLMRQGMLLPFALPDDRTVIFTRWFGSGQAARLAAITLDGKTVRELGVTGVSAIGYLDGHLLYLTVDGSIMAVPLDSKTLTVRGDPVLLVTDVKPVSGGGDGRFSAALSANGTLVYLTGSPLMDLVLADSAGITPLITRRAGMNTPRYSPDGKQIALFINAGTGSDVWVYTVASATLQRLTTEGTQNDRPEWTPDGQRVLYRSNRGGTLRLWSQPVSGGDSRLELERPGKDIWEGQYAPDGGNLVFRTGTLSTADIWVTPSTGKGPDLPVAATPAQENSARISPDGKWVLYTSLQNGNPEVFVARFPAMTDRLQVSSGGGSGAIWGDNRTIYYRASWQLVTRVTLNTDGAPSVVRREDAVRRELITAAGPAMMDIAPDKKRLLVLVPSEQGTKMVVAVGWQHELRRLLVRTAKD
jgi:serine/threonine-protein kinase